MKKILLVDDSLALQKTVKLVFSGDLNYDIKIANTPNEVMILLEEYKPHCVIGYARFARPKSLDFYLNVRKLCNKIAIVADNDDNIQNYIDNGFAEILYKPFHSDAVKKIISNLLEENHNIIKREIPPLPNKMPPLPNKIPPLPNKMPPLPNKKTSGIIPKMTLDDIEKDATLSANMNHFDKEKQAKTMYEVPEITMDIDSLEKSFRATVSMNKSPINNILDNKNSTQNYVLNNFEKNEKDFNNSKQNKSEESLNNEMNFIYDFEDKGFSDTKNIVENGISFDFNSMDTVINENNHVNKIDQNNFSIEIKEPSFNTDIENIITKKPKQGMNNDNFKNVLTDSLKDELKEIADDTLMRVIERTIPAKIELKIDEKLPDIFANMVKQQKIEIDKNNAYIVSEYAKKSDDYNKKLELIIKQKNEEWIINLKELYQKTADVFYKLEGELKHKFEGEIFQNKDKLMLEMIKQLNTELFKEIQKEKNNIIREVIQTLKDHLLNDTKKWLNENILNIVKEQVDKEVKELIEL